MFPQIEHRANTTPKQSRLTNVITVYLIIQMLVTILPIFLFKSYEMFFSILSSFLLYFILIAISIYSKDSCYLPFAILLSFSQFFQILTSFGAYFQHKNFNLMQKWPSVQIYQLLFVLTMLLGWIICFFTYREYKAVKQGWGASPGLENAQSMGYGQVPDEERSSVAHAFNGQGVAIG